MNESFHFHPEIKEIEKEPKIKLFGNQIDEAMCDYAALVNDFDKTVANKENYDTLSSWQQTMRDIDSSRKFQHDKTTRIWLESDFYNGTYNQFEDTDPKTFAFDKNDKEERFLKARKMVARLTKDIYLKILDIQKETPSQQSPKISSENIKKLIDNNILKYHTEEDLKEEVILPPDSQKTIFHPVVDKAIKNYIDSNNIFSRQITRFERGSKKAEEFIRNADENKTNFHREIVRSLVIAKLIPPINEQIWLYEKWNNKADNKLRQLAEKLSDYYVQIVK